MYVLQFNFLSEIVLVIQGQVWWLRGGGKKYATRRKHTTLRAAGPSFLEDICGHYSISRCHLALGPMPCGNASESKPESMQTPFPRHGGDLGR